jgi:hypothetical protein
MTDGADPNAVRKLELQLWIPPKGIEAEGVWSAENEMGAFRALKASLEQ